MKNYVDITTLVDDFLRFEEEKNMFAIYIDDINIWQYVRVIIYRQIRTELLGYEIEQIPETPKKYRGKKNISILFDQYIKKNIIFSKHRDVLMISMVRKKEFEPNKYMCIYTDELENSLKYSKYVLSRTNISKEYVSEKSKNILNYDVDLYVELFHKEYTKRVNKFEAYNKIIKPIEEWFGIKFDIQAQMRIVGALEYRVRNFEVLEGYYEYLLNKTSPRIVILTAGYDMTNQVLIKKSKELGIPTVELEHGMTGRNNMAYNFLNKRYLESFPDYFFCFGQYDKECTRWPIDCDHVIVTGFPYLEKQINKFKKDKLKSEKKIILFISQMNPDIFDAAKRLSYILDSECYSIVLKLHPSEYGRYYEDIKPIFDDTLVTVIHTSDKDLYTYINSAEWVVGEGSSTALFEATCFDVKIAVIKTSRIEENVLSEYGNALEFDDINKLAEVIENNISIRNSQYTFFEENSINKMCDSIEKIIMEKS